MAGEAPLLDRQQEEDLARSGRALRLPSDRSSEGRNPPKNSSSRIGSGWRSTKLTFWRRSSLARRTLSL